MGPFILYLQKIQQVSFRTEVGKLAVPKELSMMRRAQLRRFKEPWTPQSTEYWSSKSQFVGKFCYSHFIKLCTIPSYHLLQLELSTFNCFFFNIFLNWEVAWLSGQQQGLITQSIKASVPFLLPVSSVALDTLLNSYGQFLVCKTRKTNTLLIEL